MTTIICLTMHTLLIVDCNAPFNGTAYGKIYKLLLFLLLLLSLVTSDTELKLQAQSQTVEEGQSLYLTPRCSHGYLVLATLFSQPWHTIEGGWQVEKKSRKNFCSIYGGDFHPDCLLGRQSSTLTTRLLGA